MPKAVAIWLIDNTALTFEQIANACKLNTLEVQAIADGEVAIGVIGCNPITTGELTAREIQKCERNRNMQLQVLITDRKKKKEKRAYVPIARRKAKPDAISWLLKYYPTLSNKQIVKLVGTTNATIDSIAKGTHHSISSINPKDPVLLKLCSKEELDDEVLKAKISDDQEAQYNKARQEVSSN